MLAHQIPVILGGRLDPSVIFAEMPGAWLEPRIGGMWQENTGTTPITAAGQSIGKINDLSGYGYNATQAIVANRPTLQYANGLPIVSCDSNDFMTVGLAAINVRRNLLMYSEDFTNAAWSQPGSPVAFTTNAVYASPYNKLATLICSGSSAAASYLVYSRTNSATQYTFTLRAKQQNKRILWLYHYSGGSYGLYYFDLGDGTTQIIAGSTQTGAVSIRVDGDGWYRCSLTLIGFSGSANWGFGVADAKGSTSVTPGGGIYIADAQLELGSVASDYQKITDWTSEQFSSSGSVYFALNTGVSALHNQSIGTSYSAPIQSMDLYGAVIVPSRLSDQREAQLQTYFEKLAGLR